ncbi:MFS transporter [Risungbinella massiliensis]|uniref:MFS transporter n=1 Tax=Risungbinella massiliensis TaxID=1329796 RepID=UPI0005CB95A2|nr:MFS transporter [Risungbinella massiliensis]
MDYEANIWKLYVVRFFYNLIPAYVIERLFWEQKGMTIQLVVYTEIIFAITVVLLEVPTGIIADKWGRKKMIVLSALLECGMLLMLVFATEFWHFAVAIFLAGVARSASSGSENALLYDSLMQDGKQHHFEKYLGRLSACDLISAIIAALCGSYLANRYDLELNYWISIVSMMVALYVSMMLIEPTVKSTSEQPIKMREYLIASITFFRKCPDICLVVLSGMMIGATLSFMDEFWQLYLNRLEFPILYFGLFSAAMMILRLPGNFIVPLIKRRFRYRTILSCVTLVFAGGFFCISIVKDDIGLVAILLICLFSGVVEPLTTGYLHHRTESSMRATIDSFQSLGLNAILIFTGLGFGFFSSKFDVFGGFGFIALVSGFFWVYFNIMSKKHLKDEI